MVGMEDKRDSRRTNLLFFAAGFIVSALLFLIIMLIFPLAKLGDLNLAGGSTSFSSVPFASVPVTISALFSPDAEDDLLALINSATKSIDIEIYTFSSDEVVSALIKAKNRGVNVRVIMEKRIIGKQNEETFVALSAAGVKVRWASTEFKLTHSKFMVIDGTRVLVGSHNLSKNALRQNREASVIFTGPEVSEFIKVFEEDWVR